MTYKLITREDGKQAIFKEDKRISNWFDKIYEDGLLKSQSKYYIVQIDDIQAVFHEDDPDNPISLWLAEVRSEGLVRGEGEYYIAGITRFFGRDYTVFHKDRKDKPLLDWTDLAEAKAFLFELIYVK